MNPTTNPTTDFENMHEQFLSRHLQERSGERQDRLRRGHREAEKLFCRNVWWPLQKNFDHLHPEYEVTDWRGLNYFCDFVWMTPYAKLAIEIKGFGPHVQDMDRRSYCRELNRETFLTAIGFQVISFAYDDVSQRPELCMTLLRMVLGRYRANEESGGRHTSRNGNGSGKPNESGRANKSGSENKSGRAIESKSKKSASVAEREIIRLACTLGRPLRPLDVREHLGLSYRTTAKLLNSMCERGLLRSESGSGSKRVVRYALRDAAFGYL
ncbi:DUF559 domain-containing protein [Saccharibacillus sacchari]|uniref:DUF559 domain-containing protein n=1 Tax=Saccharibacillus sacchari TaxID=456493 RepID=A0ACC6PHN4_9BACL